MRSRGSLIIIIILASALLTAGLPLGSTQAPPLDRGPPLDPAFRPIDGVGANPEHPTWGTPATPLVRVAPAAYAGDGQSMLGPPALPGPRTISNTIHTQGSLDEPEPRGLSNMAWQWGQFLDHDISLTETNPAEHHLIPTPASDPWFAGTPIPFARSVYEPGTGTASWNPREPMNEITAYIDASNVYGSDLARATALRTFHGGLLATSAGQLLPFNEDGLDNGGGPSAALFLAGDVRANEQVGLTALHILFVREHNRLAQAIQGGLGLDPSTDDELIYQLARRLVGAQMQAITYEEFLPALLGPYAPSPMQARYDEDTDPSIRTAFSTALYRFGHSMVPPALPLTEPDGSRSGKVGLLAAFFSPGFFTENPGNLDALIRGLASSPAQQVDVHVVDPLRSMLFGPPGAGGLDLASLNIQRGRDHGLASYNDLREAYGLEPARTFADVTSNASLQSDLESLYAGNVDALDAWVGALAEDRLPGASVGPLVAAGLIDQFERLRDGDPFFYTDDPLLRHPEIRRVLNIEHLDLADVIEANTGIEESGQNPFTVPGHPGAPRAREPRPGLGGPAGPCTPAGLGPPGLCPAGSLEGAPDNRSPVPDREHSGT